MLEALFSSIHTTLLTALVTVFGLMVGVGIAIINNTRTRRLLINEFVATGYGLLNKFRLDKQVVDLAKVLFGDRHDPVVKDGIMYISYIWKHELYEIAIPYSHANAKEPATYYLEHNGIKTELLHYPGLSICIPDIEGVRKVTKVVKEESLNSFGI